MTEHFDLPYLSHILDAITDIEKSTKSMSKEQFTSNKDAKDANVRRLEIIGEAVKKLSPAFREKYKEVQWTKIAGTRDVIIHKYFDVDYNIVWNIIKNDLPPLKEKLQKIALSTQSQPKDSQ